MKQQNQCPYMTIIAKDNGCVPLCDLCSQYQQCLTIPLWKVPLKKANFLFLEICHISIADLHRKARGRAREAVTPQPGQGEHLSQSTRVICGTADLEAFVLLCGCFAMLHLH